MESRAFITRAAALITKIEDGVNANLQPQELQAMGDELQVEVDQLFAGLTNPTLPSAYRLRDAALDAGLTVDPRVQQRLAQFEFITG